MRKAGSALLGHPVWRGSAPWDVRLVAAVEGRWLAVGLGPCAEGDSCCPQLVQGWREPSSLHPILLHVTEKNRILL